MNWRGLGLCWAFLCLMLGSGMDARASDLYGPLPPELAVEPPRPFAAPPTGGINPIYKIADRVLIEKTKRTLTLFAGNDIVKTYKIALGSGEPGRKVKEGDRRTPVGLYRIAGRNPNSNFHLSLLLDYPNREDRARAESIGVDPGNNIAIHGLREDLEYLDRYHVYIDWTDGFIAVTNEEMEEIYRLVPDGALVEIQP